MATTGNDSGGTFTIQSSDEQVLALLRSLPDPPTASDHWSSALNGNLVGGQSNPDFQRVGPSKDKATADMFHCDPRTYRKCLELSGHSNWEAGNPAGHRSARQAPDPEAREW